MLHSDGAGWTNPRALTSGEYPDGLWRTGTPDDPRRSEPDRLETRLTVVLPFPTVLALDSKLSAEFILDRIQEMDLNCPKMIP